MPQSDATVWSRMRHAINVTAKKSTCKQIYTWGCARPPKNKIVNYTPHRQGRAARRPLRNVQGEKCSGTAVVCKGWQSLHDSMPIGLGAAHE